MKEKPKFVFTCQNCGKCCREREIQIYLADIRMWHREGVFYTFLPYIKVVGTGGENNQMLLEKKQPDADEAGATGDAESMEKGGCPFFDAENDRCTQYDYRPLTCRAFPLGNSEQRYFITDTSCPGIGKGSMTAENLAVLREDAQGEYAGRDETRESLPPMNTLFTHLLLQNSAKHFNDLTDEQKRKLLELFDPDKK